MRRIAHMWHRVSWHLREVVGLKTTTHSIAIGFAIGTFIAIIPLFGMSVLFGVLLVFVFKKVSKLALFGAMAFWNPFMLVPVYWISYEIGNAIFGTIPVMEIEVHVLNHIYLLTRRLLVGNMIVAVALSCLSYFLMKLLVQEYRKRL